MASSLVLQSHLLLGSDAPLVSLTLSARSQLDKRRSTPPSCVEGWNSTHSSQQQQH